MVEWFACPSDPQSYVGGYHVHLVGSPMPNRSKGRGQTKRLPGPPGWGLGCGLITRSCKKHIITETRSRIISNDLGDVVVTPHTMRGSMTHWGESQTEALGQMRSLVHPKNVRGTARDGVHGMRQELLQPTEKIGGILWRPYVPRGTKKLGNR